MAYYGLRSVLIVYAIDQLGIPSETTYTQYGYLTLVVYLSQLLGGFLGDFLFGARNGILLGFGMCLFGSILLTFQDFFLFYASLFLIAIGSGFVKTSTFSFISHYTAHDRVLLEKRFISMYAVINLGAFLSSLLIAWIGEAHGYMYSFLIVLALYGFGLTMTFIISNKTNTTTAIQNQGERAPIPITRSLLIILLVIISSTVFWLIFDQYSMETSFAKIDFLRDSGYDFLRENIWSASVILLLILSVPYFFIASRISVYIKLAISLTLIGICWGISVALIKTEIIPFGFAVMITLMIMEGIADIFLTPSVHTLLTVHSSNKYYGTIFGLYALVLLGGQRILNYVESSSFEMLFYIGLVILLVASIVLLFILPLISRDSAPTQSSLEEEI